MDQLVLGLPEALLGHQLFFIELFARAQTDIPDLDIHIGLQAGKADQVAGQGVDLHGRAHIKDKNLTAVGISARQHDQAHCLGHRHEIANDVRMRHRDRAAAGDLFLEDGDDRTVAAQDIAEAHGDKLGLRVF